MRSGAALLVCATAWLLAGCEELSTGKVLAQVLEAQGDAFVIDPKHGRVPLQPGDTIARGRTVETGTNATALISLLPGMAVELQPGTSVAVEDLRIAKSTHELTYAMRLRAAKITLAHGSLLAMTPITVTPAKLEIATPAAVISAPEAATMHLMCESDTVRAVGMRGEVALQSKAAAAIQPLAAGQSAVWNGTAAPASVSPLSAEDRVNYETQANSFEGRVQALHAAADAAKAGRHPSKRQ